MTRIFTVLTLSLLVACTTTAPKNTGNICSIFREKDGWYDDARDAQKRWDSPIPIMMAIMHQESRFQAKAKPPKKYFLGFIPAGRKSSAYGYSQAKTSTWKWYKDKSGNWGADRDNFEDAIDFVGWYNDVSRRTNGIDPNNARNLYLAYHEGHGGFSRGTYNSKAWLLRVADKVSMQASRYRSQLAACEDDLNRSWLDFFR